MSASRIFFAACIVLSLGVTAGVDQVGARWEHGRDLAISLALARQAAAQADGLAMSARMKGDRDPWGRAADALSLGPEPRALRVLRLKANNSRASIAGESFRFDSDSGKLDYTRIYNPESGTGVRVEVRFGGVGQGDRFLRDVALALVFLATFGLLQLLRPWFVPSAADSRLKTEIRRWVGEARGALTRLGIHVREMVREAKNLAEASARSRGLIGELRRNVHFGIRDARDARTIASKLDESTVQAEVTALNLVIEASRLGEHGGTLANMAEELHRTIHKIRKLNQKSTGALRKLELELEPVATDADVAFHSYDDVFRASQGMHEHITCASEALIDQARQVKKLGEN